MFPWFLFFYFCIYICICIFVLYVLVFFFLIMFFGVVLYACFNIFLACLYVVQKQELQIVKVVWFEMKSHSILTYISLFAFELIL
jgi:hypothetical protein